MGNRCRTSRKKISFISPALSHNPFILQEELARCKLAVRINIRFASEGGHEPEDKRSPFCANNGGEALRAEGSFDESEFVGCSAGISARLPLAPHTLSGLSGFGGAMVQDLVLERCIAIACRQM